MTQNPADIPPYVIVQSLIKESISLAGLITIKPGVETDVRLEPIHPLHKMKVFTSLIMAIERGLVEVVALPENFVPDDLAVPEQEVQHFAWPQPEQIAGQSAPVLDESPEAPVGEKPPVETEGKTAPVETTPVETEVETAPAPEPEKPVETEPVAIAPVETTVEIAPVAEAPVTPEVTPQVTPEVVAPAPVKKAPAAILDI